MNALLAGYDYRPPHASAQELGEKLEALEKRHAALCKAVLAFDAASAVEVATILRDGTLCGSATFQAQGVMVRLAKEGDR